MIPLALTRADVADYVSALILVYVILILLNILIGWMPRMPFYSRWFRGLLDFVTESTDPYLDLFKRHMPSIGLAGINIYPIFATLSLVLLGAIFVPLIRG